MIKTQKEINGIKASARVLVETLELVEKNIKVGVTTNQLDKIAYDYIISKGGKPAFKGHHGFPNTICKAVNDEIVHGIPDDTPLQDGDKITVDCGVILNGYFSDSAFSKIVGGNPEAQEFIDNCQQILYKALNFIKDGVKVGDLGHYIEKITREKGYKIFKDLTGHGVGNALWEPPQILNFGKPNTGPTLKEGMIICVEPIIGINTGQMVTLDDDWTIVSIDGTIGCQWEHMILIKKDGCEILTKRSDEDIEVHLKN
ncbi:type I methionyl aminopeptidase [bacterium]|jgi:methionyl aminopeptidase|nr:type I methionyl aminopeptidase [bacterium]MBT6293625.1 type I methionyl aminopeptidase [bacterium]